MIGIQILAILFVIWMVYFSYLHYKRREFSRIEFILWNTLWFGLLLVVLYPTSVRFILNTFNISRTFDLVVVVAIIVLFGVTFRNYVLLKRVKSRLEELVRKNAIDNHNENINRS